MIASNTSTRLAPAIVRPGAASIARDGKDRSRARPDLPSLLRRFAPISLAEMDGVALQDRIDTKYVLHVDQLLGVLRSLAGRYRVLEIDGLRMQHYHTLYFDTDEFALYHLHHGRRRNRYKVRSRKYVDTCRTAFEVKHKLNADHTVKHRLWTRELTTSVTSEVSGFLYDHLPADVSGLEPRLANDFRRITLVSTRQPERLTVDVGLRFSHDNRVVPLPGVVIAEVKQAGHARASDFLELMRDEHIRAHGFSKYCIGVSLLYPNVKHNNFKPIHRLLGKLTQGDSHVIC